MKLMQLHVLWKRWRIQIRKILEIKLCLKFSIRFDVTRTVSTGKQKRIDENDTLLQQIKMMTESGDKKNRLAGRFLY